MSCESANYMSCRTFKTYIQNDTHRKYQGEICTDCPHWRKEAKSRDDILEEQELELLRYYKEIAENEKRQSY